MLSRTLRAVRFKSTYTGPLILGIESSCDDTGVAVLDSCGKIIGETLKSQGKLHNELGGIIPTIARDMHNQNMNSAVTETIEKAGIQYQDLDGIAVSTEPGLALSLQVGLNEAKRLASTYSKPLIPIHHMQAHALTVRLTQRVDFPFLVFLISGGHCLLVLAQDVDKYKIIGSTTDVAPGDALDKLARRLKVRSDPQLANLSGGAAIETLARNGDPHSIPFPNVKIEHRDCDMSFSGIGSKSNRYITQMEKEQEIPADGMIKNAADLCASFQYAMLKHMAVRLYRALLYCTVREFLPRSESVVVLSGGVASNQYFRSGLKQITDQFEAEVICPPPRLCCDNGVMIAWNGVEKYKRNIDILTEFENLQVKPRSPLGDTLQPDLISLSLKNPKLTIT